VRGLGQGRGPRRRRSSSSGTAAVAPERPQERLWVTRPPTFALLRSRGGPGAGRVSVEMTAEETLVEGPSGVELRNEPRPLEDSFPA
jgi:hypothetical protein